MAQQGPGAAPAAEAGVGTDTQEVTYATVEKLQRSLKYTVPRAQAAILWERAAPRLTPVVGITSLFMASAWSGAWSYLQPDFKMAGIGLATVAFTACLYPLLGLRFPSRREGIARVDANTGLAHEPVATILGKPGTDKPESVALWEERQKRMAASVGTFRAGTPRPDMKKNDPYGIRFLPMVFAVMALAVGGLDGYKNLNQPFDWTRPVPPVIPARVDAWVAPPEYTRKAPVFLTVDSVVRSETPSGSTLGNIPVGTRMTIRVSGGDSTVTVTGGAVIEKQPAPPVPVTTMENGTAPATTTPRRPLVREYEIALKDDGRVNIEAHGGVSLSWTFDVTADTAPNVSAQATPNQARPGAIDLQYEVKDDYGAVTVDTRIQSGEPPKTQSRREPRPLVAPPVINLPVPRNN